MNEELLQKFTSGYNEGMFYAVQLMASEAIRIVHSASTVTPKDREVLALRMQMRAKEILKRRGLIPYDYDVLTGKKDAVQLDFNMMI